MRLDKLRLSICVGRRQHSLKLTRRRPRFSSSLHVTSLTSLYHLYSTKATVPSIVEVGAVTDVIVGVVVEEKYRGSSSVSVMETSSALVRVGYCSA